MVQRASRAIGIPESMTEKEQTILHALEELEGAVKRLASATPKPNLAPLFDRLEQLTRELPGTTDPNLLHYLRQKSYEKARLWLEGRDVENTRGNCTGTRR